MTRQKKPPKTCYACDKVKTSKEHVPPQCFFPPKKLLKSGDDLRKNLISVPSCDEHNSEKSKDDFYLLFVILGSYNTNQVAQRYYNKKMIPLLKELPNLYRLFGRFRPAMVSGLPTGAFECDITRLQSELRNVSRAVYLYHYNKKWLQPIDIVLPNILSVDAQRSQEYNYQIRRVDRMMEVALQQDRRFGNNQEVFYYQIRRNEDRSHFYMRIVFYEGFPVIAYGRTFDDNG